MLDYLSGFSPENIRDSFELYHGRLDSLEKDLSDQESTLQEIYKRLRDSKVIIINASGNSLKAADWGLARYKQDKREVYSGDTAPGVNGLSGKKARNAIII